MFQTLADLGAKDGMLLDGGDSSSVAIGTGASVKSPGTVDGWRPQRIRSRAELCGDAG
jgi:hypothetical protein